MTPHQDVLVRSIFFTIQALFMTWLTRLRAPVFKLYDDVVPKTARNFRELATGQHGYGFSGSIFHRIIPNVRSYIAPVSSFAWICADENEHSSWSRVVISRVTMGQVESQYTESGSLVRILLLSDLFSASFTVWLMALYCSALSRRELQAQA